MNLENHRVFHLRIEIRRPDNPAMCHASVFRLEPDFFLLTERLTLQQIGIDRCQPGRFSGPGQRKTVNVAGLAEAADKADTDIASLVSRHQRCNLLSGGYRNDPSVEIASKDIDVTAILGSEIDLSVVVVPDHAVSRSVEVFGQVGGVAAIDVHDIEMRHFIGFFRFRVTGIDDASAIRRHDRIGPVADAVSQHLPSARSDIDGVDMGPPIHQIIVRIIEAVEQDSLAIWRPA